jgi:hypothetical protein
MVYEQVGPFLREAMTQVSVTPLTNNEKTQITELAERMAGRMGL